MSTLGDSPFLDPDKPVSLVWAYFRALVGNDRSSLLKRLVIDVRSTVNFPLASRISFIRTGFSPMKYLV
jgi:hypothetical protein